METLNITLVKLLKNWTGMSIKWRLAYYSNTSFFKHNKCDLNYLEKGEYIHVGAHLIKRLKMLLLSFGQYTSNKSS